MTSERYSTRVEFGGKQLWLVHMLSDPEVASLAFLGACDENGTLNPNCYTLHPSVTAFAAVVGGRVFQEGRDIGGWSDIEPTDKHDEVWKRFASAMGAGRSVPPWLSGAGGSRCP